MPQQSEVLLVVTHPQSIPVQLGLVLSESLLRAVVQLGSSRAKTHWLMNPTCFATGSRPMCNLLVGKSGSG